MPEIVQTELTGAMRQAHTLLRAQGSCVAMLRMPGLAASGDITEQLGLATPTFQDLPLGAVAFQKQDSNSRLMVSADAVLRFVHTFAFDSADVLFETAVGVLIEATLYLITSVVTAEAAGKPYCYWLTLQQPAR
jgi:hypothetical protein